MTDVILQIVMMLASFGIGVCTTVLVSMAPKKPKKRVLKRDARGRFIKG